LLAFASETAETQSLHTQQRKMSSPEPSQLETADAGARSPRAPARDRRLLYVTAFLRAISTSVVGVTLGVYLARRGLDPEAIGVVVSAGLTGAVLAALCATLFGDRTGRRRFLLGLTAFAAVGTAGFAFAGTLTGLAAAAFVGMLNGMGRDRGAALILEQAALPSTASARDRTRVIAGYTVLQDIGHAVGALLAGAPAWFAGRGELAWFAGRGELASTEPHRYVFLGCAGVALVTLVLYAALGESIDQGRGRAPRLSPESRRILTRISSLFALDALGGGFLTSALLSYFFFTRFGASEAVIGALFFAARLMNAASHLAASVLARRIGLVNTMVFTHIPSSLLLVTVAIAPSFPVAAVLFLLREGLVEMDVPTRQSYVLAVVQPEERTLATGVTNLVRLAAWAVAPAIAGLLTVGDSYAVPLITGAALKIAYDLLLYRAFRTLRPPEER
jgi:MFS family permease